MADGEKTWEVGSLLCGGAGVAGEEGGRSFILDSALLPEPGPHL